ncbi:MAG: hypothetical protein ACO4AY_12815 [Ilumatobacteraceae bacterium]
MLGQPDTAVLGWPADGDRKFVDGARLHVEERAHERILVGERMRLDFGFWLRLRLRLGGGGLLGGHWWAFLGADLVGGDEAGDAEQEQDGGGDHDVGGLQ